jgi:hypothetical protein
MSDYSGAEKFLHRFYLSNYFISKASFELEASLFEKEVNSQNIEQIVFVTGLARSGTTAIMRTLYQTGVFASLTYNNMPFLFMPNLWKNKKAMALKQRAHQDGIMVNGDSPEEFDEYFWKVFLKDQYIGESLTKHDIPTDVLTKYQTYVSLICKSQGKKRYLSKNNNNLLRIEALQKLGYVKIIFMYRHPLDHSSSLLKLHQKFTLMQKQDPFILEYFNYLGHHEFGSNHKQFKFSTNPTENFDQYPTSDINYWLSNWINYYNHLLEINNDNFELVAFEDLIHEPGKVFAHLYQKLLMNAPNKIPQAFRPTTYGEESINHLLMKEAMNIFNRLNSYRSY